MRPFPSFFILIPRSEAITCDFALCVSSENMNFLLAGLEEPRGVRRASSRGVRAIFGFFVLGVLPFPKKIKNEKNGEGAVSGNVKRKFLIFIPRT